jgi:hypothetical protein
VNAKYNMIKKQIIVANVAYCITIKNIHIVANVKKYLKKVKNPIVINAIPNIILTRHIVANVN